MPNIIINPSLQDKIGKLLIIGYEGQDFSELQKLILEFRPRGIIFFKRNFPTSKNPEKTLREIFDSCQNFALKELNRPLLIAIDQEGGVVQRLKEPFKYIPSATDVALNNSPEEAYEIAKNKALDLVKCGFNYNFSPVLDVKENDNGFIASRSFSTDQNKVILYATQYLKAYKDCGILSSGKHFPTLGSAAIDPHYELPTINLTKDRLLKQEIIPYKKLITQLNSIMTTHAIYPALDKDNPATFSKTIINLIKNDLNFKGPVLCDDLEMGAIVKNFPMGEAAVLSIKAGHYLLLICCKKEYIKECQLSLYEAIKNKTLSEERINDAIERSQTLFTFLKNNKKNKD